MRILFFTEARLTQTADRKFYSSDQSFSYQMFKRYLKVFESVQIVARSTVVVDGSDYKSARVNEDGVEVLPLPHYIGPYQYLKNRNILIMAVRRYIDLNPNSAVICRVPGVISTAAANYLARKNRPYGVEIVGDPLDVFAPDSYNHPFRALFRYIGARDLRFVVKGSAATIYVTKKSLQTRYPPAENTFNTNASNAMLPPAAFASNSKKLKNGPTFTIVAVGTLAAMYKAPDVAIEAIALLKRSGLRISLKWLGEGRHKGAMIKRAILSGVADRIHFVGNVGSAVEVRNFLDAADLFILPSRTEGLPRALVEAMARGLPCIGTAIGGIPELLDEQALVPVNNPKLLADKITTFLTVTGLADAQAERNLKEAQNYAFDLLETRRIEFYQYLRSIS